MVAEFLYGELADFEADISALRRHYLTAIAQNPLIPYRAGESKYQGWAITSRDGTIKDGLRKNNHDPTIINAVVPTPLCTGVVRDLLENLQARGLDLYRARIFRLADGYEMKFHTDGDEVWRLHVPILSTPNSLFEWQLTSGEVVSVHLPADGHAWLVRVDQLHRAINTGVASGERVHFIASIRSQPQRAHFGRVHPLRSD